MVLLKHDLLTAAADIIPAITPTGKPTYGSVRYMVR